MKKIILSLLFIIFTAGLTAQDLQDKEAILNTLNEFAEAIIENDSSKAATLLHEETMILEGGNIENKQEYLSHHFHSDGRFLSALDRETISQEVSLNDKTAWVTTKSRLTGEYNERELELFSLELAVLKKEAEDWKIVALHWSSADAK